MTADDILELIVKNARQVLPALGAHMFRRTDRLKDLGANSIDRSEIVIMTLEDLALTIPLIDVAGAANIGELADLLHAETVT